MTYTDRELIRKFTGSLIVLLLIGAVIIFLSLYGTQFKKYIPMLQKTSIVEK